MEVKNSNNLPRACLAKLLNSGGSRNRISHILPSCQPGSREQVYLLTAWTSCRTPPSSSSVYFYCFSTGLPTPELTGKDPPLHSRMLSTWAFIHSGRHHLHPIRCLRGDLTSVLDSKLGKILPSHRPLTFWSNRPHTCLWRSCSLLCFLW